MERRSSTQIKKDRTMTKKQREGHRNPFAKMSKITFSLLWLLSMGIPTADIYAQRVEVGLGVSLPYYKKETSNDRIIAGGKINLGVAYLEHRFFELYSGLSHFAPAGNSKIEDELGNSLSNKYKNT